MLVLYTAGAVRSLSPIGPAHPEGYLLRLPLRFHPYLRPLVWGGRALAQRLGKHLPSGDAYGESWEVSDHPSHQSLIADGAQAGKTLSDLMTEGAVALLGCHHDRFPWLVKYLDAHDWLSVQVHPSDENVDRLWPGERGKTECWFVLETKPGSRIYAGLRNEIDESALRKALATGHVADCLHSFSPSPGDFLFLPAGTVHAVGGGVLFAEVQQSSDATFRLFDWNRVDDLGKPRTLHVDQALLSIDWSAGPVQPVRAPGYPDAPEAVRQSLARCRYFDIEYLRQAQPFTLGNNPRLELALVLHGEGSYLAGHTQVPLTAGSCVLFPARTDPVEVYPLGPLNILLARLPA